MAVWSLLSISQTGKAANVTVYFQCLSTGFEVKDYDNHVYTSTPTGDMGTLSEFVKNSAFTYTLTGDYNSGIDLNNESTSFVFDGDGKYTYTFTAAQTGRYCF